MSEIVKPEKTWVLEIGCGYMSAVVSGGTLFKNPNTQYIGIDLEISKSRVDTVRGIAPGAVFLQADAKDLPIQSGSIDFVIMRSVFGQFSDSGLPFTITNVRLGLIESYRVLTPKGRLVVLEENTPWYHELVKSYLMQDAGFEIEDFAIMEKNFEDLDQNSRWLNLRSPFFSTRPLQGLTPFREDNPYILIGKKPSS